MSVRDWCCFCLYTLTVYASLSSVLATDIGCPTWHYYNNATGQCECGASLLCSSDANQVEIENGLCATSSGQEGDYYIGFCPFVHPTNSTNRMYSEMPSNASQLDEVMCGPYNRRGLLCGECKDGYGPGIYSFDLKCADCSTPWPGYTISLYLFLQFVPTTLIFIALVIFRINITSGPLLRYILFCQASVINITYQHRFIYGYMESNIPESLRILFLLSVMFSQFWSLRFFEAVAPAYCISDTITGLHIHMLNFIPAIYPFVLVIISCILMELHARNYRIVKILWRPFKIILSKANITDVTSDAVFHAFASFIFLSNITVLFAMFQVLNATTIYSGTGQYQGEFLYIDPKVEWLGQKSILYVLVAAVPFIFISLIPSLLLCIYPTRVYRYLSRFLSARKQLAITAFAEALHSCFKDGLNGTRDYRALIGAILFLVLIYAAVDSVSQLITGYDAADLITIMMWMMFVCGASYIKPCKSVIANMSLIFHVSLFGILMFATYLWQYNTSAGTLGLELTTIATFLIPHILVALWVGYTLTKHTLTKFGYQFHGPGCKMALSDMVNGVRLCLCRRHRDYQEMDEQ